MGTVTIQEAQAKLPDLIHNLSPGDDVVITENNQPVAKLVSQLPKPKTGLRPPPGLGKGFIAIISEDDEHLMDFDYICREGLTRHLITDCCAANAPNHNFRGRLVPSMKEASNSGCSRANVNSLIR
jgi:prevent-host-death family protein